MNISDTVVAQNNTLILYFVKVLPAKKSFSNPKVKYLFAKYKTVRYLMKMTQGIFS
jgi:hypothetical protein